MKADGSVVIKADVDVGEAEKELGKLRQDIKKTQDSISRQEAKRSPLAQQAAELRRQINEAKMQADEFGQAWRSGVIGADAEQSAALERVHSLNGQLQQVKEKIDTIDAKLDPARADLEAMTYRAGELNQRIARGASASEKMGAAMGIAKKHADKFSKRIGTLMKRVLVFSVILRLLNGIAQWFGKVIKASPEAREAIADLKGALLTLAQPLVEVILPAFTALVSVLSRAISMIAKMVSFVFGKTADQSREAAKALNEQVEAMDGVGGAAKKAGKSLAGFDEINKLSGDSGAGGGAAGAEIKPDFSGIQGAMAEMEVYMSGALLALGALLTFTSVNIPLGLGLMAVGAMGLASAVSVNWDTMPDNLRKALTETMLVLGGASLVIGAILAFAVPGQMGLGIGLMIAGAAALGTAVELNWDCVVEALRGPIGKVTAMISGALLVAGALFAFASPGTLGLGIGLMAAGAVGLATTVAVNWDHIVEAMRGPVGQTMALLSGALFVIGAIIAFSGAGLPLGLGLMVAGAAGLATAAAVNWGTIGDKVKSVVGGLLAIASGSLLAMGVLLCLSGAGIGLGLALIYAGLAGTKAAFNLSDNPITRFVKKMANSVIGIINMIIDAVNELFHIRFDGLDIGGVNIIPAFNKRLINLKRIPQLAQGAVIPPNREFMAVLGDQKSGTNIETPLATMVQAFKQALAESGGGGGQTIILQIDGREFGRAVKKYGGREDQRIGVSLVGVRG